MSRSQKNMVEVLDNEKWLIIQTTCKKCNSWTLLKMKEWHRYFT